MKPAEFQHISKNTHVSNFMKIRPMGAKMRTKRHNEDNSRVLNFANAPKNDHDISVCSSAGIRNFRKERGGVR
jgi:hypothetical protein